MPSSNYLVHEVANFECRDCIIYLEVNITNGTNCPTIESPKNQDGKKAKCLVVANKVSFTKVL